MVQLRWFRVIAVVCVFAVGCGSDSATPSDEPADIPAVDLQLHSVPLDEIVFDTFDGGSVLLSDASPATILRLLDAIPPINNPVYESAEAANWLVADDVVLGYIDASGSAWAYPVKILDLHEIVNDIVDGEPILVSYCPLCGSGIVYARGLGEQTLTFSNTSALHENDMVMVDRETGSYWWQVAGTAIVGALTGDRLETLPSEMVRFSDWVEMHPDTAVLARPTIRDYTRDRFAGYSDRVSGGSTPFPVSEEAMADGRLPAGAVVLVADLDVPVAFATEPPRVEGGCVGESVCVDLVTTGVGGTVTRDGVPVPVRTMLWFAAVAAFPNVELAQF